MQRKLTLTLDNCDLEEEELAEIFADALDGYLPVDDSQPIVVSVDNPYQEDEDAL